MRKSASLVAAIAMLLCTLPAFGQRDGQSRTDERLKQMAEQLNLTDAQKDKIKPILADQAQKLQALRGDTSITRQEKFAKAKSINDEAVQQIRPLLTPDQQQKYDAMRAQMKEDAKSQMRERRQDAQPQ